MKNNNFKFFLFLFITVFSSSVLAQWGIYVMPADQKEARLNICKSATVIADINRQMASTKPLPKGEHFIVPGSYQKLFNVQFQHCKLHGRAYKLANTQDGINPNAQFVNYNANEGACYYDVDLHYGGIYAVTGFGQGVQPKGLGRIHVYFQPKHFKLEANDMP